MYNEAMKIVEASKWWLSYVYVYSHAGQNYWTLIGWERGRHFFDHEGIFGNQEAWLLDADWLSTPHWVCFRSGFKRTSELHRFWVQSNTVVSSQFSVKQNQHAIKGGLLVEKQKDFSDQKCNDSQPEKCLSGGCWRRTKLQNFMAAKLKVNFFVFAAERRN